MYVCEYVCVWLHIVLYVYEYTFYCLCVNSVSEYSDENMMDASNLAICFGPTLLPVPTGKDQVQFQPFVNELIKNIIIHYEVVFPFDGELLYEKCIVEDDRFELFDMCSLLISVISK